MPKIIDKARTASIYRYLRTPWRWHPTAARSRAHLAKVRDRHAGQAGVILATGPSLLETDLEPFKGLPCIGLNRIYLAADQIALTPDYLICVNDLLVEQCGDEIVETGIPCFLPFASRRHVSRASHVTFLNTGNWPGFERNAMKATPVGATVTYAALELAHWMGFSEVYLLGVDHSYQLEEHEQQLSAHETSQRTQNDNNHIHPDYFGRGMRWQLPDLDESEKSYTAARNAYEDDDRKIFNSTPGSQLDVFDFRLPSS